MAKIRVDMKLEGLDEALKAFNRFDQKQRIALRSVVRKTSNSVRTGARGRIHNISGELSKSIKAKYAKDGFSSEVGAGSKKAFYAHMVEFGTVKMSARPFMNPTAEEVKPQYLEGVRRAVKGAIK